jgi:hypothetical protein
VPEQTTRDILAEAQDRLTLVRLTRAIRRADKLEGFVAGVGHRWVLLSLVDDGAYLNGFAAIRLTDVKGVVPWGGSESFAVRALRGRGEWPPHSPEISLDSAGGLLRDAADVSPLVTLHVEVDDPTVCFIGRPVVIAARSVRLLEVTPDASWEEMPTTYRFSDVTRIEFGGRYEAALASVAGAPPSTAGYEAFFLDHRGAGIIRGWPAPLLPPRGCVSRCLYETAVGPLGSLLAPIPKACCSATSSGRGTRRSLR